MRVVSTLNNLSYTEVNIIVTHSRFSSCFPCLLVPLILFWQFFWSWCFSIVSFCPSWSTITLKRVFCSIQGAIQKNIILPDNTTLWLFNMNVSETLPFLLKNVPRPRPKEWLYIKPCTHFLSITEIQSIVPLLNLWYARWKQWLVKRNHILIKHSWRLYIWQGFWFYTSFDYSWAHDQ